MKSNMAAPSKLHTTVESLKKLIIYDKL